MTFDVTQSYSGFVANTPTRRFADPFLPSADPPTRRFADPSLPVADPPTRRFADPFLPSADPPTRRFADPFLPSADTPTRRFADPFLPTRFSRSAMLPHGLPWELVMNGPARLTASASPFSVRSFRSQLRCTSAKASGAFPLLCAAS